MGFGKQRPQLQTARNRRKPKLRGWGFALLLAAVCSPSQSVRLHASGAPNLANAHAIHSMPPAEAAHRYPVHLRAVLTFYDPYVDPRRGVVFVCDRSGCVFVSVPRLPVLSISPGDLLEIAGNTGPGDFASIIEASQIRVVGHPGLPAQARRVTMDDLASGVYDTDWIQVEGRVRSIHREPNIVALVIASKGGSFGAVTVPEAGVDYDRLVDSLIQLTANTAPSFNQRRQMVAVHLFFPSMRQVRVLEPAPPDPFGQPPISVLDMFRFSPDASVLHRVHIQGTVTLSWPGRLLCIQDRDASLCMPATQATRAPVGSHVDVVGFPAIHFFKPTLEYASFRPSHSSDLPIHPIAVAADHTLRDDFDGKLIEVQAELVGRDSTSPDSRLEMRANGVLFSAILPREIPQSLSERWKDGSLVRVTGICSTEVNTFSVGIGDGIVRPESVRILLRDGDDIVVLRAPSWWTPQHTWESFGAIGFVVAICLGWIGILRHLVKNRTRELRTSQERLRHLSEHDALTDLPNRILLHDRLSTAFQRVRRFNGHLGLLMADLDGFKEINDAMGHKAGDTVLREVAGRLRESVRCTDTVARIGGDEFVILLTDLDHAAMAELVAAKLVAVLAGPFLVDGKQVQVTASIGIATFPDDGVSEEILMQLADEAMYRAKQRGKNRIEAYHRRGPSRLDPLPAFKV